MTDTTTLTLAAFLEQRIAEDEAAARAAQLRAYGSRRALQPDPAAGRLLVDPTRVLAECEAKRRIVARADADCVCTRHGLERVVDCGECATCEAVTMVDGYVLADLAAVYADHEDYREEWRP